MAAKARNEIEDKYKWTIDEMYPAEGQWEKELNDTLEKTDGLLEFRGRLGDSAAVLADAIELSDEVDQSFERLYTYAHMKLDEDNGIPESQARLDKAVAALAKASALTSFMTPEITSIPEDTVEDFLKTEPRLKVYEHLLRDLMRSRSHVLSEKEEAILANLSEVLNAPDNIFTMLSDLDFSFGTVKD